MALDSDPREEIGCLALVEKLEDVLVSAEDKKLKVGSLLSLEAKGETVDFLEQNRDVFAWKVSDMPGIGLGVIIHCMSIKEGALTYERLVNMMFAKQLGRNVEAYVDGMIVKSRLANGHCIDLQETFDTLQKYRMKLNPEKCAFRMQSGKFLGFMINQQGIETNLEKVPTILYMASPRNVHEVQKLTGRLTALNRFLTRSGDKCYPFFQALKRARNFAWSEECEVAFEGIKEHLHTLPALVKQMHDETLSAYLRVSDTANYMAIEKWGFMLVMASRKLHPYFMAHHVVVHTDQPLKQVFKKYDATRRKVKWAMELSQFNIDYTPRTAVKPQALADFINAATGGDIEPPQPDKTTYK
ncbi:hypothetical protein CRG98_003680 [Punica granatum]|uniref:Uncharacterized protein n=1 Tax=Punica granatum TaxID=22663 RepID=A0A2I0L763_PUNGR|nr:hypothetical protein CRG98_003680 [Punica granatum]